MSVTQVPMVLVSLPTFGMATLPSVLAWAPLDDELPLFPSSSPPDPQPLTRAAARTPPTISFRAGLARRPRDGARRAARGCAGWCGDWWCGGSEGCDIDELLDFPVKKTCAFFAHARSVDG
ncbi:hypothetical protein ACFQ2Y_32920 [Streptomyces malaysiensis subsp. malaysiensis]